MSASRRAVAAIFIGAVIVFLAAKMFNVREPTSPTGRRSSPQAPDDPSVATNVGKQVTKTGHVPEEGAREAAPAVHEEAERVAGVVVTGVLFAKFCVDGTLREIADFQVEVEELSLEMTRMEGLSPEDRARVERFTEQTSRAYDDMPLLKGLRDRWWYQPCSVF